MTKHWKIALAAAIVAALWYYNHVHLHLSPQDLRVWLLSYGAWAPVIYIAIYTIRPLLFFPATPLCIAGGLAFGPWWGTVFTLIGFIGDAALAFAIGRRFGSRFAEGGAAGRLGPWLDRLRLRPFRSIVTLRLIPIVPFDAVSYAAGYTHVRFAPYLTATVIGTLPVTVAYSALGSSLTDGPGWTLWVGLALLALFVLVPAAVIKLRK
ncbi:TVP38/TMEM64 family protein [Paenibacillus sp. TRM 82003]|nr:TVP38/TMEM64 family protein [Paenibacillus sp. TRM 82003]